MRAAEAAKTQGCLQTGGRPCSRGMGKDAECYDNGKQWPFPGPGICGGLTHPYLGENLSAAQMVVLIGENLGKFPESG